MGQTESAADGLQPSGPMVLLQNKLTRHAIDIKEAATISYCEFLNTVQELNKITNNFGDVGGKTLVFQVKKGTDTSMWWRGTVRIKCHKVFSHSGVIESSRLLNLKQYIRLYKEIKAQASMTSLQVDQPNTVCASMILTQMDSTESTEPEECCICMDRQAVVILPCSHIYCEQCIDQWSSDHKTCPICRATVQGNDDTWVLTEKPDKSQMAYEATGYLMGLADRTGSLATNNSDE
ncbi:hypothetical protein LSH36_193g07041 [Paralvinella palmiformis]|uniref:RING finger protein 141 n=1 Tax=Paralvinella palmiformis TaxID=53620 RepID=A0AAD9JQ58_9ANNE|nr:hypothetical protein LSH36_193g07041 [Paralvinella palmiformis]